MLVTGIFLSSSGILGVKTHGLAFLRNSSSRRQTHSSFPQGFTTRSGETVAAVVTGYWWTLPRSALSGESQS